MSKEWTDTYLDELAKAKAAAERYISDVAEQEKVTRQVAQDLARDAHEPSFTFKVLSEIKSYPLEPVKTTVVRPCAACLDNAAFRCTKNPTCASLFEAKNSDFDLAQEQEWRCGVCENCGGHT